MPGRERERRPSVNSSDVVCNFLPDRRGLATGGPDIDGVFVRPARRLNQNCFLRAADKLITGRVKRRGPPWVFCPLGSQGGRGIIAGHVAVTKKNTKQTARSPPTMPAGQQGGSSRAMRRRKGSSVRQGFPSINYKIRDGPNRPPWLTKSRARLSLPSYLVVVVAGHVISARCNEENYRRRAQQMPPPRRPIAPSDAPCVTRRDKSSLRRAVGPSLLCPALYFADE